MIQHTPEPWTIEHNHPDCAETAVIYGPDGQYVAHTSDQDAPLIAAAPRLLAACRWFCDHPGVLAEFAGPGLDLARSAVAADSSPVYDSEFGNSWVCDAPTPEGLVEIDQ